MKYSFVFMLVCLTLYNALVFAGLLNESKFIFNGWTCGTCMHGNPDEKCYCEYCGAVREIDGQLVKKKAI